MPTPKGITFKKWDTCSTCGLDYPLPQLVRQKGQLVCKETCIDQPTHEDYLALLEIEGDKQGSDQVENIGDNDGIVL